VGAPGGGGAFAMRGVPWGTRGGRRARPGGGGGGAPAACKSGLHPVQQLAAVHEQALALQAAFHEAGLGCLITDDEAGVPVQPETALRLCLSSLRLASSLLQWWQRPEHAVTDRLLLAQIAAARSCAYLGCTNLQSSLGPAAVKGEGRLKCRWAGTLCVWGLQSSGSCLLLVDAACMASGCCSCRSHPYLLPSFVFPCFPCSSVPPLPAASAWWPSTAAPPARMPTGARAGTTGCAGRCVRHGMRTRSVRQQQQQPRQRRLARHLRRSCDASILSKWSVCYG